MLADLVDHPSAGRVFLVAAVASLLAASPAILSIVFFDRREFEPAVGMIGVFAWGAIAATALSIVVTSTTSTRLIEAMIGTPTSELLLTRGLSFSEVIDTLDWVPKVIVAPYVEEALKLLGLVGVFYLMRGRVRGMKDGIVLGATLGLGFAVVETAVYVVVIWDGTGTPPHLEEIATRFALFGFAGHTLWTALAGAGLGLARTTKRRDLKAASVIAGFFCAVAAHSLQNALAPPVGVTVASMFGVETGEQVPALLLWAISAITWIVIQWPFMILLGLAIVASDRWERTVISRGLHAESPPVVTEADLASQDGETMWRQRTVDGMTRHQSAGFVQLQNRLALRRWSAQLVGLDTESEPGIEELRAQIVNMRRKPFPE